MGPTFASRAYGAFKLLLLSQKKIEHTVQNPATSNLGLRGRPASSRSKLTAKRRGGDYSFKMRQKRQQSWVFL